MKTKTILLTSMVLAYSTVFADSTPPKVSIQQALSAAEKAGYTDIREIELEDGQWEVSGRDTQGKEFEIKIDAATGALSKEDRD
ncbi:PepSY domain-containing protein [Legionella sp. PC1000]|uniref:PepSY domain-containing protein n=1 Tax=Legionella sp. PC1000 TaxID=2746060 RepID=UPI0015FBBEF2|nr:PepSY domain-containing protein [Legionella sp. PC1000]QLZ69956.1 PepSY domain-containing protein [Legionella sp. PC1000]